MAAFLVVAAVGLALVVGDMASGPGAPLPVSPAPPPPAGPAWALVAESVPWRLAPDALPPRRVAVLNLGDAAGRPPEAALEGAVFLADGSGCAVPVRPGRGCVLLLGADPLADGPVAGRVALAGSAAALDVSGEASGFAAQIHLQGEPVFALGDDPSESVVEAAWRISNVGVRPVRAPLSVEGAGFAIRGAEACPEILPPGAACEVAVAFAPIAVGAAPGRLRAGGAEAALLGTAPETLVRAELVARPAEAGWEAELRNLGPLAFVAPRAAPGEGAVLLADGCAGRPLSAGASCRVRLAGGGMVFLPLPVGRAASAPP